MNGSPLRVLLLPTLLLPLLLAPACKTSSVADLARNEVIYTDIDYTCKLPGDRSVFLSPLADARESVAEAVAVEGGYPLMYDGDGRWDRPIVEMVDDLLRRELEHSGVFARVLPTPAEADVVLVPALVTFATGAMECESGGRSLAEVGVRVQAFGPVADDGTRPLLLDQLYGDRRLSDVAFRTVSRHVLAGTTTRAAIQRLLQGLDSKSIGRAGMPAATAAPVAGR